MTESAQETDRVAQVVALVPGHDPKRLRLTAAEGFLLSRIDGRTPWRLLREIGGIPAQDVDTCLERWLNDGLLEIVGNQSKVASAGSERKQAAPTRPPMDAASAPKVAGFPCGIDAKLLDAGLDIDCEVQRRILEFELSLSRPYHELLGVPVGADAKVVKRAYFKLSKEFHPDRYFRRQIGPYAHRLDRIFKKVLEAHEILSDPDLCQVENQSESGVPEVIGAAVVAPVAAVAATPIAGPGAAVEPQPAPQTPPSASPKEARPLTKLERLKQRMPFKIDHAAFAARRSRALEIFRAAQASLEAGRLHEAEANIRIAITFDPARAEFKEALGSLRIRAAGDRASKLLAMPSDTMNESELRDALQLIEDVLPYRPHDPELNARAAQACLQLGKHDDAVEYAHTLLERSADVASHHSLLGRIERARGDLMAARRAFEKAIEIDREDLEARKALASMRIAAHDAAQGGRR